MTETRQAGSGTAYAAAVIAGRKAGAANATDAQLMALFCEDTLQILAGAFSSRLVWEGAQKAGLTALALHSLCAKTDLSALDDLQWS